MSSPWISRAQQNEEAWRMAVATDQLWVIALQVASSGAWWPTTPGPAIQLERCCRSTLAFCRPRIRQSLMAMLAGIQARLRADYDSDYDDE